MIFFHLLQLGVLRFGLEENGNVGVGIFPNREEILIRGFGLAGLPSIA